MKRIALAAACLLAVIAVAQEQVDRGDLARKGDGAAQSSYDPREIKAWVGKAASKLQTAPADAAHTARRVARQASARGPEVTRCILTNSPS